MEIITLRFPKGYKGDRKTEVEAYVKEHIIGENNTAVIVAGIGVEVGKEKIFQVLVLNDVKLPLQWGVGTIYRHPIEEGKEKMALEYMSKSTSVFVYK